MTTTDEITNVVAPLGDLTIMAQSEEDVPRKLERALRVLSVGLHQNLALNGYKTKTQCILCALTARDFLQDAGMDDATVVSTAFTIRADRDERCLHSLGIGVPENHQRIPGHWNGHLVVVLKRSGWLIDPTLYQAQRPQWAALPGMVALRLFPNIRMRKHMATIAGFVLRDREDGTVITARWHSRFNNGGWVGSPDSINARRAPTVDALRRML